ncbi:MAG: hypothetical protein VW395_03985, partial [Methylotenera sp.]
YPADIHSETAHAQHQNMVVNSGSCRRLAHPTALRTADIAFGDAKASRADTPRKCRCCRLDGWHIECSVVLAIDDTF